MMREVGITTTICVAPRQYGNSGYTERTVATNGGAVVEGILEEFNAVFMTLPSGDKLARVVLRGELGVDYADRLIRRLEAHKVV